VSSGVNNAHQIRELIFVLWVVSKHCPSTHGFQLDFREALVADACRWWWGVTSLRLQGIGEDEVNKTAAFGTGLLPVNPPGNGYAFWQEK